MKLSQASSYAFDALAYIVAQKQPDLPIPSHKIAKARGIPTRFLLKVLNPLVRANVLTSTKGPNGGYRLKRPIREISVLEILEAVDGRIHGVLPPQQVSNGPLHRNLDKMCKETALQVRMHLEKLTLADLLPGKG